MVNLERKDEIIRFVMDASEAENARLAVFLAGIRAQERRSEHQKGAQARQANEE
jgi:hypothetical protein